MLRKNVAGQFLYFAGVNATTGAALTGATFSVRRAIDGTFAAGGATITEDTGLGLYKAALTQADTNGNDLAFFFTATNAVPVCINALTTTVDPSTDTSQTGDSFARIGAAGAGLTNIGTIATVTNLTNLPAAAALEATLTAMKGATFSGATDSLEALRDRGDAAWATATGFATPTNITAATGVVLSGVTHTGAVIPTVTTLTNLPAITANWLTAAGMDATASSEIADQVWDEVLSGHLTAGTTGAALNAAGSAGDPWSTAIPGAYGAGTAGKILGDNINATISSRASQTSVDTIDDLLDTEVAAIKSDTAAILLDTGTDGVVVAAGSKTGYSLTATTGLGNQTANITGNLSGSVGSVTATVNADMLAISGSTAAADNLEESTEVIGYGTCTTGGSTTSVVASAVSPASAVNDQYNGRVMIFKGNVTAALAGQATTISDYVHATLTFTVVALTTAPANGDLFTIL